MGVEQSYELFGFADASEKAIGAVVYSRSKTQSGYVVRLLASKSKLAPTKVPLFIPKLELTAALLLTSLVELIIRSLNDKTVPIYLFTDSMAVLGWILQGTEVMSQKVFVKNRTSKILNSSRPEQWHHVEGVSNPADIASRGVPPSQLADLSLWWQGAPWMTQENWSSHVTRPASTENTQVLVETMEISAQTGMDLINKYSSLQRLTAVFRFMEIFIQKIKRKPVNFQQTLRDAECRMIKLAQREHYANEIESLETHSEVARTSTLKSLNPFLDAKGILRVGGRMQNAPISYNERHPIIIPNLSNLATLIIRNAHKILLHGALSQVQGYIRCKYWIPKIKRIISQLINICPICQRWKNRAQTQLMGSLPEARVTPSPPFTNTGVDFCGPFDVRTSKYGKNKSTFKCYVAIFICMCTRGIHIEIVSDLTYEAFRAAFTRFTARRGTPSKIFSDNGTTFIKTARMLKQDWVVAKNMAISKMAEETQSQCQPIEWTFIPPYSPNFGGLWEAAVKSTKYHMKRILTISNLTYEEFATVLTHIEGIVNSRPVAQMSEDPNNYSYLTPAHFLTGRKIVSPDEPLLYEQKVPAAKRWQLVKKMYQDFWKAWYNDYLSKLQMRSKWKDTASSVKVGDLVILKYELLPPTKWPIAMVHELHPGRDGLTRVVTLRTSKGSTEKRSISKIIPINLEGPQRSH
jgi:hypothetical protein